MIPIVKTETNLSVLYTKNLKKAYGPRVIVQDVSLLIRTGEIVGLLGPNGAGKTTSFYMLLGLIDVDEGKIFIDDEEITHAAIHRRAARGMSYLPQEPSIFRRLTVSENIMAVLELQKKLKRSEQKQRLKALMEEFHITHIQDTQGISLSGGERRRVEIARAVAGNPKFILLDEPFSGIDPISIIDLKNTIKKLSRRGIGILITDHNVRETLDICERSYVISEGQVICEGPPETILSNLQVQKVYLGQGFTL